MNPIETLNQYGQFVWLDYLSRRLITSGELQRLIERDRLGGVTSNPTIFNAAIGGSPITTRLSTVRWPPIHTWTTSPSPKL